MKPSHSQPIAIVAMSAVYPDAPNLDAFAKNLFAGHDACRATPADRWIVPPKDASRASGGPDHAFHDRACLIRDFAPNFENLRIESELLKRLDPLFHLVLHVGRDVWLKAQTDEIDPQRVSIALAAIALPTDASSAITREILGAAFELRLAEQLGIDTNIRTPRAKRGAETRGALEAFAFGDISDRPISASKTHQLNAGVVGLPAQLLRRALGVRGRAFTLDAACASSLYAIKIACDDLQAHRADAVIAGGVSRPEALYTQMGFSHLQALSRSGTCRPFDAAADGLIVGEGCGMIVLKRLDDALAHNDNILGVIRGIGLSNDTAGSLLAADSAGQLRAMRAAYAAAGWRPSDVDIIECHGTGTPLGDAVEFSSLRALWKDEPQRAAQTPIGSVKSMVGHLLTAAGIAGLHKILLGMQRGQLPPSANFESANPKLDLATSPFWVLQGPAEWTRTKKRPRRAAVSSFGFGGINAHLLLEQFDESKIAHAATKKSPKPVVAKQKPREPIAIVGIGAHVGNADTLAEFAARMFDNTPSLPHAARQSGMGVSPEPDAQDERDHCISELSIPVGEFKLPPSEITQTLPQQLLMLLTTAAALRDARLRLRAERERTGVLIGANLDLNTSNYHLRWAMLENARRWSREWNLGLSEAEVSEWAAALREAVGPSLNAPRVLGSLGGIIASRIARELGCGGPSFVLSAGPHSGIDALDFAVNALRNNELDEAVVGTVDLCGDIRHRATAIRNLAHEAPFNSNINGSGNGDGNGNGHRSGNGNGHGDGNANGNVNRAGHDSDGGSRDHSGMIRTPRAKRGAEVLDDKSEPHLWRDVHELTTSEGSIAFVLKRLSDAEKAGDHIYALIDDVVFPPQNIAVSGEINQPASVLQIDSNNDPLFGDTGACTAMISILQAAVSLDQRRRPAPCDDERKIPEYWLHNRDDGPRRAIVSAQDSQNLATPATIHLREYEKSAPNPHLAAIHAAIVRPALFVVSADTRDQIAAELTKMQEFAVTCSGYLSARAAIETDTIRTPRAKRGAETRTSAQSISVGGNSDELAILNECASRWHEQNSPASRNLALTIVATSFNDLQSKLATADRWVRKDVRPAPPVAQDIFFEPNPTLQNGKIAFVYPGSGNQYNDMGLQLARAWPVVMHTENTTSTALADEWINDPKTPRNVILATVSLGIFSTKILQQVGIQPDAAIGYSVGETTSLLANGVWSDRDEMRKRLLDSSLFDSELAAPFNAARREWRIAESEPFAWRTAAVRADADTVKRAVARESHARLLIVNSPNECVIGGESQAVARILQALNCDAFSIDGVSTVHCDVVRDVQDDYLALHRLKTSKQPHITFYSTASAAQHVPTREAAAKSITRQALHGFDFSKLIEQAYNDGVRCFIEVGPGASCTRMIAEILAGKPHLARSIASHPEREAVGVVRLVGALIAQRRIADASALLCDLQPFLDLRAEEAQRLRRDSVRVPIGRKIFDPPLPARRREATVTKSEEMVPRGDKVESFVPDSVQEAFSQISSRAGAPTIPSPEAYAPGPSFELAHVQNIMTDVTDAGTATAQAHARFLAHSHRALEDISQAVAAQARWLEQRGYSPAPSNPAGVPIFPATPPMNAPPSQDATVAFNRTQCMEFAVGKIAHVLGPRFAAVDEYPVRVRLPDEPLMLVDRIVHIEGEVASLSHGRIVTEHDVHRDAWYLDNDRAPVCITVEAGQADLFLCSYLGIDLAVRGTRAYRLLDATIELHSGLPRGGDVISYDIRIEKFVRQGSAYLFFFSFVGTINGRPLITMTNGCAGFFTDDEIENSGGIVALQDFNKTNESPRESRISNHPALFAPIENVGGMGVSHVAHSPDAKSEIEQYSAAEIDKLREGNLGACFGPAFAQLNIAAPCRIPAGRMRLLHRITHLDMVGGPAGLGRVIAEADIQPDDWFLTCHFVDDMVMPGTLMYECCAHTLRVLLSRFGWVGEHTDIAYEPVVGVPAKLKCRGPVTTETKVVTYQVDIQKIGFNPAPYVIANALMCADGRPIVTFTDMSMQLTGLTKEKLQELWNELPTNTFNNYQQPSRIKPKIIRAETSGAVPTAVGIRKRNDAAQPEIITIKQIGDVDIPTGIKPGIFEKRHIMAFSNGKPSEAFGAPYKMFDADRRIARLPGPPYQFLDRITEIQGPEAFVCKAGGWIEAQYDIPHDEWYFASNRQSSMPFGVLLEIALQPCGWLAAYVGSALTSDRDLSFRNLGGTATQYAEVFPNSGTLTIRVRLTDVSKAAGMIIQKFDMQVWCAGHIVYDGNTSFGFFTADALSNQVGIRDAAPRAEKMCVPTDEQIQNTCAKLVGDSSNRTPCAKQGAEMPAVEKTRAIQSNEPAMSDDLTLPARDWLMLDQIECFDPTGGPDGLGYIRGTKAVDPNEWFFKAHFYQDPVIPGSLGLESCLQLLKYAAIQKWGESFSATHRFAPLLKSSHTWVYRGQVIPRNKRVTVEAAITKIIGDNEPTIIADGFLSVDGIYIYEMKDFAIQLVKR
ncbi:MAG: beta-ketoacyl synthase N-terminal-like domain-containing protein [Phycisphaerae bacterium]